MSIFRQATAFLRTNPTERASVVAVAISFFAGCGDGGAAERDTTRTLEVVRDEHGVAHVYAENDQDLFYGYGYQLASDRLYQLDYFRRRAYGRGAEALGGDFPGVQSDTIVGDDRLVRMFDCARWGAADARLAEAENPERYELIQAWVDGINRRVREVRDGNAPLPPELERLGLTPEYWSYADPFVTMKMAHLVMDQTILYKVLMTIVTILAPDAQNKVDILKPARPVFTARESAAAATRESAPPFGELAHPPGPDVRAEDLVTLARAVLGRHMPHGSNNWAITGEHTESARPLIAGDPHLGAGQSGYPYAIHLNSADAGGTFDAAGFAFVAGPGFLAGRNRDLVWTPTSSFGDPMDFWSVKSLEGGKAVEIAGKRVEVIERQEVFHVKGADDVVDTMRDVPGYGVLFDPARAGVPLRADVLAGPGREVLIGYVDLRARPSRWFLEMNRATDLDSFDAAASRMHEMSFNLVAASRDGITYHVGQEIPARKIATGIQPWRILDGDDPNAWWGGLGGDPEAGFEIDKLTEEQLPSSRGGSRGFVVTANNDPFGFTADGDPGNDEWYFGAFFLPGWRAGRITDELGRLSARGAVTAEEMKTLQFDATSGLYAQVKPVLAEAFDAFDAKDSTLEPFWNGPQAESLRTLMTLLRDWNGEARREESAPVAFFVLTHTLSRLALSDDISVLYDQIIDRAPMYLFKIMALTLTDEYANGYLALQKNGMMCKSDDPSTCDLYTKSEFVMTALVETVNWFDRVYGSVDPKNYTYGDWHRANMEGGYGLGGAELPRVPADGDESTVNIANFTAFGEDQQKGWVYEWMPIVRSVGSFDSEGKPALDFTLPFGNVADESSPYFDNLREHWSEGTTVRMFFERPEIEAHADDSTTLDVRRDAARAGE